MTGPASPAGDPTVVDRILLANDVRGEAGVDLTPEVARAFGVAAAEALLDPGQAMLVGRDMRSSGLELAAAFADGVTAAGHDVLELGLVSTDQLYFATAHRGLPGVMVTASHNPAPDNGFKFSRADAVPVGRDQGLAAIGERVRQLLAGGGAPQRGAGVVRPLDLDEAFAQRLRGLVDLSDTDLHVAVDAGNGMAGKVVPLVFDPLPVRIDGLCFELDGTFPNHPANPHDPANVRDLSAHVVRHGLPLGLAFDGDADRVFAVDERGRPVSSSLVGAVVATRLLARSPGSAVLHNLICSRAVPEAIREAGGVPIRTPVGHSFIKHLMVDTDAVFAVEHSGHYYFRDFHRADSGLLAALYLLEAVAAAHAPLSEVLAPWDRYVASGERNVVVEDVAHALARVRDRFAQRDASIDTLDGVSLDLGDVWANVRGSNTEPVLRINVEGRTQDRVDALVAELRDTVA